MMALAVIGGVISAVGSLAAAQAQADAANYNAAVNDRNAKIALEQGEADAARQKRENLINLGRLRASFGGAGLAFEGDAISIYADAVEQTELDVANIRYNAKLRSIGYTDQAQLDRMEAKSASTAGILGAMGAIVGGVRTGMQGTSIMQAA